MKKITVILFSLISIFLHHGTAYTWDDKITHKDISRYAADYSILRPCNGNVNQQCDYLKQIGFSLGLKEKFTWNNVTGFAEEWLARGGELEDYSTRWRNHFHNPLKNSWLDAGLSDIWWGQSALLWAQSYNGSQQPMADDWSWQRTRKLYHLALSACA